MRSSLPWCLFAACVIALATSPAHADCDTDVARLRSKVAQFTDPTANTHFVDLVRAAVRQMMEGDEEECRRAVEAADKAIDTPAEPVPAPAAPPPPPAAALAPSPLPRDPGPAPRLLGTAIGPSSRIAIFAGRDGMSMTVFEGDPIGGYTVQAIRHAEVDAIGGGTVRTLHVGLGDGAPADAAKPPPPNPGHGQGSDQHLE